MGVTPEPLRFDRPPAVSLMTLATHRGRRLESGAPMPAIEAHAARLFPDPDAYARVCGFPSGGALPLTYPDVLTRGLQLAVLTHALFPFPLLGILHTEQRIEARRPLYATEAMSGRSWVAGLRPARKGVEFELHSAVTVGGEDVWHATSTILSRALPGDGVKRPRPQEPAWTPRRSVVWRLPADQGRRYAAVSGDNNPIHLTRLTARAFGFSRPIAHGWWALARALAELDTDVAPPCVVNARFSSPMPLPGRVVFTSGPLAGGLGQHFELRRRDVCLGGEVRPLG